MKKLLAALLPLILAVPALAHGGTSKKCGNENLRGLYVFTATGFQRAPGSPPGTPWIPKAILEVMQFNGDGSVTVPNLTIANPPTVPDAGLVVTPPTGGNSGEYTIHEDCSGFVHFFDAGNVTFQVYVDRPRGDVWMIQSNPAHNVFQGVAKRVD